VAVGRLWRQFPSSCVQQEKRPIGPKGELHNYIVEIDAPQQEKTVHVGSLIRKRKYPYIPRFSFYVYK